MSQKFDSIKLMDADGKVLQSASTESKIYTRKIKGFFQRFRKVTLWLMMSAFFITCWIQIDGQPLILFDIQHSKYYVFGMVFWPQDFFLLAILLIIAAFALFFITTIFGRVWCGYTCPQTAWSFVFMWLEERIEGSRNQRIKLDKAPMSVEKATKRVLKHASWLLVAFITGFTFIAYFYPARDLATEMFTASFISIHQPLWIMFFTLATYINAGWMREAVCMHICPYARFQSVMFNHDTLLVAYDEKRGEPRGKNNKQDISEGHCVDCELCVQVCPTGIDIRDGLQYECIGCALCIDACDSIMDKMNYEKGLIRYTTETELEGGKTHFFRPRLIGYSLVLAIMITGFVYAMLSRTAVEIDVIRDRNSLYQPTPNDTFMNSYTLEMMNMSQGELTYRISIEGLDAFTSNIPNKFTLHSNELRAFPITIDVDPTDLTVSKTNIEFIVIEEESNSEVAREESRFIAPLH